MGENLKRADALISSCPACKENFYKLFCTFTCSADNSLLINVTSFQESTSKKLVVTELDYLVSDTYGGGFFDRTLAAMPFKPLVIGVGYELQRIATIYPQPHDIPMDRIVTEA